MGSVHLSEPLVKIQRNLSGQTFEMKVLFNKILFLFFTITQNIRLSICVHNFRAPYRGRFENNNVFLLKKTARPTFFHLCKIIEMTCVNICLLAQFPRMEKIHRHAAVQIQISKTVKILFLL